MLLEKLLKEFNFSINTFNLEESKLFDRYFERILIGKDTFLIKEGEIERYSYFVYDGMLRCWLLNHKGEEQIFWLIRLLHATPFYTLVLRKFVSINLL